LLAQLEDSDWIEWQRETFRIFGRQGRCTSHSVLVW
jgi:hypothetical protein